MGHLGRVATGHKEASAIKDIEPDLMSERHSSTLTGYTAAP
jgi:hypothetical protein